MQTLEVGDAVMLTGRFVDADDMMADPDDVTLNLTAPDGTLTVIPMGSLDNPDPGMWEYMLIPDQEGLYVYEFVGVGTIDTRETRYFLVGTVSRSGPCGEWASIDDVQACGACATADPATLARMLDVATEFLYVKSGQQWPGICVETVRPCRTLVGYASAWGNGSPINYAVVNGNVTLICGCGGDPYRGQCTCGTVAEIALPGSPVVAVTSITIDGDVVPATSYRVDDDRWLVRTDEQGWPTCQNLAADTGTGTFIITYAFGAQPPASAVAAASALACELTLACANSSDCRLPRRVTNVVREGITVGALLDDLDLFAKGRTGIAEVDMFLAWANPGNVIRPPEVFSPHLGPRARRTTVA